MSNYKYQIGVISLNNHHGTVTASFGDEFSNSIFLRDMKDRGYAVYGLNRHVPKDAEPYVCISKIMWRTQGVIAVCDQKLVNIIEKRIHAGNKSTYVSEILGFEEHDGPVPELHMYEVPVEKIVKGTVKILAPTGEQATGFAQASGLDPFDCQYQRTSVYGTALKLEGK